MIGSQQWPCSGAQSLPHVAASAAVLKFKRSIPAILGIYIGPHTDLESPVPTWQSPGRSISWGSAGQGVLARLPLSTMLRMIQLLSVAAYVSLASSFALDARQLQWPTLPNNLTEDVLQVASAISPPCAANNTWCQQLTVVVVCLIGGN